MESLTGIGVLEEMRPVETGQTVGVDGEVGRNPVEDHTDAAPVHDVDELHELLRGPEAAGGGEVAGPLISP